MSPCATIRQPHITPILLQNGREGYRLDENYVLEWFAEDYHWAIFIPEGFVYDGASVPWYLWTITGITPDGLHRAGALVHDWIYRHQGNLPTGTFFKHKNSRGSVVTTAWSRDQADKLFANILAHTGVKRKRRRLMYLGVRLGGWAAWMKATKRNAHCIPKQKRRGSLWRA